MIEATMRQLLRCVDRLASTCARTAPAISVKIAFKCSLVLGLDSFDRAPKPFHRIKPAALHYETAHMSADELHAVRKKLQGLGYMVGVSESPTDDMAILF